MRKTKRKWLMDYWRFGEHESWFSDMAKDGWHLRKTGKSFAHFERGEPKETRYRIDTSLNKNMSHEDKEMFREAGWEHITKYGEFNIFSSPTELQAPELHTDPVEQSYTLASLAKKYRKNTIIASILILLGVAIAFSYWFFDDTATLTLMRGDFSLALLTLTQVVLVFTILQGNVSFRALRKRLQEGYSIDHQGAWRKKRKRYLVMLSFILFLPIANLAMLVVQMTLSETQNLPLASDDLPIIRLADVEQNPNLIREEDFVEEQLDWLNQYTYSWSPFAPLQYESSEHGIVPGQLWQDEDVTYSPSIRTRVYQLNFPSLSEKLLADLIRRYIYDGEAVESESDVFDSLFIQEREGSQEIFAAKGKGVIYVAYYGYAETAIIVQQIEEKMALIEK